MLPYRGLLAFDFLTLAEAHPKVISVTNAVQPVNWWSGREWEAYYPRYSVSLKSGVRGVTRTVDVEVLTSLELEAGRHRFARIRRQFRAQSRTFLVFTEKRVRVQPRLNNCKFILSQAGSGLVSQAEQALIRQISSSTASFTLNEVVGLGVLTYPRAYATVLNMVAAGELGFALGRRFDGDTPIRGARS
tara:strand:+ start:2685 stop:3251 length:567 start_codon:yes stop_codon:yes gene_type:complete